MNLQEFINHKTHCPVCDSQLKTTFHSKRRQVVLNEDGRIMFKFRMNGINKHVPVYTIGYSLSLYDSSWYVEFYDSLDERLDTVPESARTRFKEFDKNLRQYKIHRTCECENYHYQSNYFKLNYFNATLDVQIVVATETYHLESQDFETKYELLNNYESSKSNILCERAGKTDWIYLKSILKFSSPGETYERIKSLVVFS